MRYFPTDLMYSYARKDFNRLLRLLEEIWRSRRISP